MTGFGQYIDMALLDVQIATMANQGMNYLSSGNILNVMAMHTPILCLIKCSKLLTVISLLRVEMTLSLFSSVEVLGYPIYRMIRVLPEMQTALSIVMKLSGFYKPTFNKTADEWVDAIYAAKVPVGVINNLEQAFQEPQVIAEKC